ncbi:hypothetical protein EW146_g5704 [Bondarzewia mesenterica]|uniref:BTB domain-containing protein n=1 Tax=Bondarzewia mesenterica TaxID=1095465 RepID=A0A4S4LQP2_9AGAM|nr:hypothetical protein EW146_g5704 [Bondarzewia mesenterica]
MSAPPTIHDAGPPFDAADADIVLRTSDLVNFRVHTSILSISSQVFKDMLSMPLPPDSESADNGEKKDGLPVITVTESEHSVDLLLRVLYSRLGGRQPLSNLSDINSLLESLDKYQVDGYPQTLLSALSSAAQTEPVMAYVLARRHNLLHVANAAAVEVLKMSLTSVVNGLTTDEHLECITGGSCVRLLKYHVDCCETAITGCKSLKWIAKPDIPGALDAGGRAITLPCSCLSQQFPILKLSYGVYVPRWVVDYIGRCEASLRTTPHWDTVTNPKLFIPSAIAAGNCDRCKSYAEGLPEFARAFANQLKSVVSKVRLHVRHGLYSAIRRVFIGRQVPPPFEVDE